MKLTRVIYTCTGFCLIAALVVGCGKNTIERSNELVHKGVASFKQKKYEEAVTSLSQALEFNGGNAQAHYYLGAVYRDYKAKSDNIALSVQSLEAAIGLDPNFMDCIILLASILVNDQQYEKAETIAKSGKVIQPENADSYYWLAESYFRRTMYEEAHAECKRGLQLNPSHLQCKKLLNQLNKILG